MVAALQVDDRLVEQRQLRGPRSRPGARPRGRAARGCRRTSATRTSPPGPCRAAWPRTSPRPRSGAGRPRVSSPPAEATPMLAVTRTWLPLSENGCDIAAASRSGSPSRPSAPFDQDGELVAAQPRHRVGAPGAGQEPLGRRDEQPVALGVAQAVVHGLEVVEVEEQHRHRRAAPLRQRQRVAHPVAEQRPVGEPGERVVERLVDELLLQPPPLAHVAGVEHDALHGRVAQQVGRQDLGVEPGAVRLAEAPLDRAGDARRQRRVAEERGGALPVLGVEQVGQPSGASSRPDRSRTPAWPRGSRTGSCRRPGSRGSRRTSAAPASGSAPRSAAPRARPGAGRSRAR